MKLKLILVYTLVIALGLLGGIGTYAWFTSSVQSTDNTFATGTLIIDRDGSGEVPYPIFATSYSKESWKIYDIGFWYPGKKVPGPNSEFGGDRGIRIKNAGTIDAKIYGISAKYSEMQESEPSFTIPQGHPYTLNESKAEFEENLTITVKCAGIEYYKGSLEDLINGVQLLNDDIPLDSDGTPIDLNFEAEMSTEADNKIQGVAAYVDIIIHGTQKINDSYK